MHLQQIKLHTKKQTNKTQYVSEAFRNYEIAKNFAHFNILSSICPFFNIVLTYGGYIPFSNYIHFKLLCLCLPFCVWTYLRAFSHLPVKSVKVLSLHLCQFFCSSIKFDLFNFTEKCDCEKINFVLFVISVIWILVQLLQMMWVHATSFVVCMSVCLFLTKICISQFHLIMAHTPHFRGTWISSH